MFKCPFYFGDDISSPNEYMDTFFFGCTDLTFYIWACHEQPLHSMVLVLMWVVENIFSSQIFFSKFRYLFRGASYGAKRSG